MKNTKPAKNRIRKLIVMVLVTGLILGCSAISASAASLAKTTLTIKQTSKTAVTLSWKKVKNADGYQVYRKLGTDGKYKLVKTISSGKTITYKDKGLTFGKTYRYKVRAIEKSGNSTVKGPYCSVKKVDMTNPQPKFTVYLPTTISQKNKTITISLTNDSKSSSAYFDGVFALEDKQTGTLYNVKSISFDKPESGKKGSWTPGKRLILYPGEKVRFTCSLEEAFDYDRAKVELTTCVTYKSEDYVSVYSTKAKNKIYTAEEYFDYITGA